MTSKRLAHQLIDANKRTTELWVFVEMVHISEVNDLKSIIKTKKVAYIISECLTRRETGKSGANCYWNNMLKWIKCWKSLGNSRM